MHGVRDLVQSTNKGFMNRVLSLVHYLINIPGNRLNLSIKPTKSLDSVHFFSYALSKDYTIMYIE